MSCWWIETSCIRNLSMPHLPDYFRTLSNCTCLLHLSRQEMLFEPTRLWRCFTSASYEIIWTPGESTLLFLMEISVVYECNPWKVFVSICVQASYSHSWMTTGRRCTRQWWRCSSILRGRQPLLNHTQFHQGLGAPGQTGSNLMFHSNGQLTCQ